MAALPAPDIVLSERLVLCETALSDAAGGKLSSDSNQASACDVLQLAARKAVGCAVGDGLGEAEPFLVLSPDCKNLAVKEPCSRRICLLSALDGFKEVLTTLEPLPVEKNGDIVADTVLNCSWSTDSKLLLVACKSSAVYLFDSTGRLLCHWDPTWPWAQVQLVAACHGPGNTILVLTAARVVFLVAHSGDKQQRGSAAGVEPVSSSENGDPQQAQPFAQQQVLKSYSVKRHHTAVSTIGYDDKSGLLVIAGDSGNVSSSSSGAGGGSHASSSGSSSPPAAPAAAFAQEGVTVSVWHLQERELTLKFALGEPQGGPGMAATAAAAALGVNRSALAAAAATRWSIVFSPLLEYVALLTGSGSVYLLSLTDNCLVDPATSFAGRSAGPHTSGTGSGTSGSSTLISPRERAGIMRPKHIPLTPGPTDAGDSGPLCRSVAWWGPRVLAVAAADGSVSLVRLPESVNILGAAPARFAAGARLAANYSGNRGLLVVEPISAAMAAAAAAGMASASTSMANSLALTGAEVTFAADASAAVSFSSNAAAKRGLAAAAAEQQGLGGLSSTAKTDSADGDEKLPWLAKKLGVTGEDLAAMAGAAACGSIAGWRLVLLAERTPQQLVQVHLRLRDWGSALKVSKAYGLDTDAVYLARWAATPVSKESIIDNLPKVNSKRARVAECLTRIAPDYQSARNLISYGLRETAKHAAPPGNIAAAAAGHAAAAAAAGSAFVTPVKGPRPAGAAAVPPGTPGGLTGPAGPHAPAGPADGQEAPSLDSFPAAKAAEVRWWRLQRLKLLALNDRLETSMALNRGTYDPEIFSVLRTEPLPKAAAALAAAGNIAGLAVLLQRHKSTLAPRLLQLLSALPESLDPRMYAALIPRASPAAAAAAAAGPAAAAAAPLRVTRPVGVGKTHGQRKVDWVESEETFRFLAAAAAGPFGGNIQTADSCAAAAVSSEAESGPVLVPTPSLDAGPGLPFPVSRDGSGSDSRGSGLGLSSTSSLDFSSWALCADETSVMMHATEELERYCSVNGANRRTLPTDAEIASWLAVRAFQLDAATGQLPDALQLLELAVDKGYGQFQVQLPHSRSAAPAAGGSSLAAGGGMLAAGADAANSLSYMPISQLFVQGRVLLQLVRSWWPGEQQQEEQRSSTPHTSHSGSATTAAGDGNAADETVGGGTAAEAATALLGPLWSVTLQQWVSVGLLPQLLAALNSSSKDSLQQDLRERVLPLLGCYPHEQRVAALHHLLFHWLGGPPATATAAAAGSQPTGSSSGSTGSTRMVLASALLAGEAELLQAAAAATSLAASHAGDGSHRQQQQWLAQASAGAADGAARPLLWDGDAAALVSAVLGAVAACQATNQWAKVEQLLYAAADALAAAAAVHGVRVQRHEEQQQAGGQERRTSSSSGNSSYDSAGSTEGDGEAAGDLRQQQEQHALQQQQEEQHALLQQALQEGQSQMPSSSPSHRHRRAGDGWGDGWSSEGEEEGRWDHAAGRSHQQQQQQEQQQAATIAATEPLRAAVLQCPLSAEAVWQLQVQIQLLRGQVRAARLLTKHGCCVSVEQVATADAAAAKDWLGKLLGRAERLGSNWPEAQWAQVWRDLLEARQSGLSLQLTSSDLAAAFLRVLLLAQQYSLAVQLLPLQLQQQLAAGYNSSTPTAGTPTGAVGLDGMGAFDMAMDAHQPHQFHLGGTSPPAFATEQLAAGQDRAGSTTVESALAALTGVGGGGMFTGRSRFGVRRALHNAAGAAVSTAVGSTAKLMGVSAHLVGSTAHLVGSTAQAVQFGTGGVMGATAGLVSGTASLVSSAAIFAAEAAAKAGSKAGAFRGGTGGSTVLQGAAGLLTAAEAEGVVVQVSKELLGSASSLEDPAVVAAEAVLQLLPPECKAAAAQRDTVTTLRLLPEFGVSLLPAQLTSLPDKHQLLQRILFGRHTSAAAAAAAAAAAGSNTGWAGSSVAPWRRLGDVLELAALLGFGSEDEQNEVRLMAAEAALSAGEVGVATYLCLQLAAVRYAPAWQLATELACPERFAAERQQRAAKVQQMQQQEHLVQQQLRESLQSEDTPEQQQEQQQQTSTEQDSGAGADPAAAAADGKPVAQLQLTSSADRDAASVSISSPATPGADTTPAAGGAAAGGDDAAGSEASAAAVSGEPSSKQLTAADDITAADVEGARQLPQQTTGTQQGSDAGLQAPGTPLAVLSSLVDAADDAVSGSNAAVTVVETTAAGAGAEGGGVGGVKDHVGVLTAAKLQLPAGDRQKLLAFAVCFCPIMDLPALTDDLVAVQRTVAQQQALRQQQEAQQQTQQDEQQQGLVLPLQQQDLPAFQQQRQQLLRTALAAAAATAAAPKGQMDPYKGLFSFGDPQALLAVLLSCGSTAEVQQLLDDALSDHLSGSTVDGGTVSGGSYCCLQRLLVVGAAAQLLLLLQDVPQGTLVEVVAGSPASKHSCSQLKLQHHQELLLQLLHVPLGQLQAAASQLQQQQVLPASAAEALTASQELLSRLQQIADGRQLLQWLPGIETGRFFAGDKAYQEQVLIELASKAGQMAVQQQQQQQQQQGDESADAEALMLQAQQLAASYGADPFQLDLWFVHSLLLCAPDISQPKAQRLLAAHTHQLMQQPAAAAAHLYYNTLPLLPAAAAGQCACVLGLIHTALQAFCTQQQQQQQQQRARSSSGGSSDSTGGSSGGSSPGGPAALTVALPQLEKLKELLVKSSKALSGLAAKALIGGHVALIVGPAVAAAAALAAEGTAPQQQQDVNMQLTAATAAAAAAVAGVDITMVLLEAASAVSAFVTSPGQAAVAAKFIRHLNMLAEMHARASVGDRPKQQALQKLAQGVSPGLPHLLLFLKTMSGGSAPPEQQQLGADTEEASEGMQRASSVESAVSVQSAVSFQSAVSASSSISGQNPAHQGHNPAAALAIEWATARARYASTSGRQQLLNCSALQLSGLAGWLVLGQQQPVPADAIGRLQPLALGPGQQLQVLTDVITLLANPEAQLTGLVSGERRMSSGGSSRGSSFQQSSCSAEQAAATAVAAAAALAAGPVPASSAAVTPLMRDDPAALSGWQPPSIPANLAPKRRELVVPLFQAAVCIAAKHVIVAALGAAAAAGPGASTAADVTSEGLATAVSQALGSSLQEQQLEPGIAGRESVSELLRVAITHRGLSAVAALQLAYHLSSLQSALRTSLGLAPAGSSDAENMAALAAGPDSSSSEDMQQQQDEQQVLQAVSSVLQQLTQAALQDVQQQLASDMPQVGSGAGTATAGAASTSGSALAGLQVLIRCLNKDAAADSSPAAAADGDEADSAPGQQPAQVSARAELTASSSWLAGSVQQLREKFWEQLQQHQAQLPAEAYSSSVVAELLELQETISSGTAWEGWSAGAGTAGAGAGAGDVGSAGGRPKGSGAGLLLARTMTALSKQWPGVKACADDLSSIDAAVSLFSGLIASSSPVTPSQCAALTSLLTEVWREGAALPQPEAPAVAEAPAETAAAAAAGLEENGAESAASKPTPEVAVQQDHEQLEQQQEELSASVGLPVGRCQLSQLHACWHDLMQAMLQAGYVQDLLALLDKVAAAVASAASAGDGPSGDVGAQAQQQQRSGAVILPILESEAQQLVAAAECPLGPAGQAVLGLLLPYTSCQQSVTDCLLEGNLLVGSLQPWAGQLLLLLLLRGQLPQLAQAAAVGQSGGSSGAQAVVESGEKVHAEARQSVVQQQLYHLYSLLLQPVLAAPAESSGLAWAYLTCLLPHAVSQLCQVQDYAAAAALVAAKMRMCGRLCTFSGSLLLLQRYLEATKQRPWQVPSHPGSSPLWLPCCEALLACNGAVVASTAHTRLLASMRLAD